MNTTSITISINSDVKARIKEIAKEKRLTINKMVNLLLEKIIKDTSLVERAPENPTPYLLKSISSALQQKKEGKVSPRFTNNKDASKWLHR